MAYPYRRPRKSTTDAEREKEARPNLHTPEQKKEAVWNAALRRVSMKDYSALEMRKSLERKEFEPDVIAACIERLIEAGWIQEDRYREAIVRSEIRKGRGQRAIQQKLRQKGLVITETELGKLFDETMGAEAGEGPLERARAYVEKKYSDLGDDPKARNRAFQALVRRGFSFDVAKRALAKMR